MPKQNASALLDPPDAPSLVSPRTLRPVLDRDAPVIVLGLQLTGLITARCLADAGLRVHAIALEKRNTGRGTRCCRVADASELAGDPDRLAEWLEDYCRRLDSESVLIPTSDASALWLAGEAERLSPYARFSATASERLGEIVSKDGLYALATRRGVRVPPMLLTPDGEELSAWCRDHPPPYLIKPFFDGHAGCALQLKNLTFRSIAALEEWVGRTGSDHLIVQRQLEGGDGRIFDCYGLTGRDGDIRCLASHRRIRQFPPDTGTTCFGEIPAGPARGGEEALFALSERLLDGLGYHGIFGIEWLEERESGELYLLDFNARPFLSIGHLADCGLNLPYLAYRELMGDALGGLPKRPRLEHRHWLLLSRDLRSFRSKRRRGELGAGAWLRSVLRSRSLALWCWHDPLPGLRAYLVLIWDLVKFFLGVPTQEEGKGKQ